MIPLDVYKIYPKHWKLRWLWRSWRAEPNDYTVQYWPACVQAWTSRGALRKGTRWYERYSVGR